MARPPTALRALQAPREAPASTYAEQLCDRQNAGGSGQVPPLRKRTRKAAVRSSLSNGAAASKNGAAAAVAVGATAAVAVSAAQHQNGASSQQNGSARHQRLHLLPSLKAPLTLWPRWRAHWPMPRAHNPRVAMSATSIEAPNGDGPSARPARGPATWLQTDNPLQPAFHSMPRTVTDSPRSFRQPRPTPPAELLGQ